MDSTTGYAGSHQRKNCVPQGTDGGKERRGALGQSLTVRGHHAHHARFASSSTTRIAVLLETERKPSRLVAVAARSSGSGAGRSCVPVRWTGEQVSLHALDLAGVSGGRVPTRRRDETSASCGVEGTIPAVRARRTAYFRGRRSEPRARPTPTPVRMAVPVCRCHARAVRSAGLVWFLC